MQLPQALADLYCAQPLLPPAGESTSGGSSAAAAAAAAGGEAPAPEAAAATAAAEEERRAREWGVQHVLLPALRLFLKPGRARASDGSVVELTRLENLYRVFERC